ncbi:MAG: Lrp/AsnC ligand binding domain-containing protein [Candidatus Bathyarchaeia archaeon]|jgi:DNA-binding Lrp family transcriptional regulator
MVEAIVLVRAGSSENLNFMKTVQEELSKVKGVKEVNGVFGRWDFVIKLETRTLGDLGNLVTDCVRSIKGIQSTETLVMGF